MDSFDDNPPERDAPAVSRLPQGKPKTCGFCSTPLSVIENDEFLAFTRYAQDGVFTVICGACISRLSILRHLRDAYALYYLNQPWDKHKRAIEKALFAEHISIRATRLMAGLALRLSKWSAATFVGCKDAVCPKTGVPMKVPRIALYGRHAPECGRLLEAASNATGMPVAETRIENMKEARAELMQKCNDDGLMIGHGILFVHGYYESSHPGPVIYCCSGAEGLPDGLETLLVDGYDLDPDNIR